MDSACRLSASATRTCPHAGCSIRHAEGFSHFRRLHDCFGCFRLERIAEWALYPLKNTTFLGVRTSIDMIRWR